VSEILAIGMRERKRRIVASEKTFHLEFGGEQFHYQTLLTNEFASYLLSKNVTYTISNRYLSKYFRSGIKEDLKKITNAKAIVTTGDGEDASPEIACMQGFAVGIGKKIYLLLSGKKRIKSGRYYKGFCNLMVAESAHKIFRSFTEFKKISF
jgi:hypothetical protein